MNRFLIPLGAFLVLAGFLAVGLYLKPREVPSPLIGKPAPAFQLAQLQEPARQLTPQDMKGKVWVLNVWASWCAPCLEEHPFLLGLADRKLVPIVGLNYKDARESALKWLATHGNPYVLSVADPDGRVGIDYGVYGVPETYVIDRDGVIRYKYIGPITQDVIDAEILPLVKRLEG